MKPCSTLTEALCGGKGGVVRLNVGGTLFTSSIITLVSWSSYFQRLLSDDWRNESQDTKDVLFIDQDPGTFSVLLSFMRTGYIPAEAITTPVLLLAKFLGMDGLTDAVKVEAIRSKFAESNCGLFNEAKAARLVDEDIRKKFATVIIYNTDVVAFRDDSPVPHYVAGVQIEDSEGNVRMVSNCVTFIDALNYVNKLGYTRFEKDRLEKRAKYDDYQVRLWFSMLLFESTSTGNDSTQDLISSDVSIIRRNHSSSRHNIHPREFCYVVERIGQPISVYEGVLAAKATNYEQHAIDITPYPNDGGVVIIEKTGLSTIQNNLNSKITTQNWLQRHGYCSSEIDIAQALSAAYEFYNATDSYDVYVWSRRS